MILYLKKKLDTTSNAEELSQDDENVDDQKLSALDDSTNMAKVQRLLTTIPRRSKVVHGLIRKERLKLCLQLQLSQVSKNHKSQPKKLSVKQQNNVMKRLIEL